MEKFTPHCRLAIVRKLVADGRVRATFSALSGAAALGVDFAEMVKVVSALGPGDFHKSMATRADHTVWQDVYRHHASVGWVYVKLTVLEDVLIVSFKEL